MFKLYKKLPRQLTVAVSGGVDSMAALHFLKSNHDVSAAFFHHNTDDSERALRFLIKYLPSIGVHKLSIGYCTEEKPSMESKEEFWRNQRYAYLDTLPFPVVTAHHLDDCVETWVWSSLHGTPKLIPYERNKVIRPFILTKKEQLKSWCARKGVEWIEDSSNQDNSYTRNFIRNELLDKVRVVNPGIDTMVKNKLLRGRDESTT